MMLSASVYSGEDEVGMVVLEDGQLTVDPPSLGDMLDVSIVVGDALISSLSAPEAWIRGLSSFFRGAHFWVDEAEEVDDVVDNAFCQTGPGGGIDPTCSPSGHSAVEIKMDAPDNELDSIFGVNRLTKEDVAKIAGALPGSSVVITVDRGDHVNVSVDSEDYHANRTIYADHITNNVLIVDETGKGLGTKIFHQQVEAAAEKGFKYIETMAEKGEYGEKYNGYYTWPRLGYDTNLTVDHFARVAFPGAERLSDLMKTKEGRKWWKKNGGTEELQFDLAKDSLSRRVLDAYVRAKHSRTIRNVFCPTGPGGGIDPTCGQGHNGAIKINIDKEDEDIIAGLKFNGKKLSKEDLALVAGALPGSEVKIQAPLPEEHEDESEGMKFVSVDIKGREYRSSRYIYQDHIENVYFQADQPGHGVGTEALHSQVEEAANRGFKYIETDCGGRPPRFVGESRMNGYYTWPRLGYDAPISSVGLPHEVYMKLVGGDMLGREVHKVSDVMKTEDGRKWWKENGTSFEGRFDLKEGSLSRRVLDAYVRAKGRATANSGRGTVRPDLGRVGDILNAFDPDQPRDERGRWTSGGGGGADIVPEGGGDPIHVPQELLDRAKAWRDAEEKLKGAGPGGDLARPFILMGDVPADHEAFAKYLEKNGAKEWTPAPLPEGVETGVPKECFKNATQLMIGHGYDYCEGIAYAHGIDPKMGFLHAWCVDKQGNVVDNTWEHPEKSRYFGVKYDQKKYMRHIVKTNMYGVFGGDPGVARHVLKKGGL